MLISLLLLALIASGGVALTYMFADEEPLLWRISAGSVAGSAIFGLVAFVAACFLGFTPVTIIGSLIIAMLPLLLMRRPDVRERFNRDWARAKGTVQGANVRKARRFAYYAISFLLLWLFFDQTVYEMKDGIFSGGSQNLGDLPFHLGAIFSFTDGNNFPPQNPSFAGAKFSYPFMSDFLTACLIKLGVGFRDAIVTQNIAWGFALLVILERFAVELTNNRLAGRFAPPLLFLSGGLGFLWFFSDMDTAAAGTKGIMDFLWHLPRDYTIGEQFRWGNSLLVLFMTQRGLLLGMPITLVVLGCLWKFFQDGRAEPANEEKSKDGGSFALSQFPISAFLVGLLAGTLPLVHVHSLAVLFIVTAFLFAIRPNAWRAWVTFGVGVAVVAIPELIWTMSGSATETAKFFGWHFGWDKRDNNVFFFWLKNTGFFIPILIAGLGIYMFERRRAAGVEAEAVEKADAKKKPKAGEPPAASSGHVTSLLLFFIPFAALFLISNLIKMAPWEWDNIKILIYWFAGSIPLVAFALAWAWQKQGMWRFVTIVAFALLVFSGSLDVWRTISGTIKMRVFEADAVAVADQIKKKTPPNALFLNAPTYNSAVVLSGRPSLMRYSGHLSSYGIDYGPRENDVRRIYEGGGVAGINLEKYNIEYVLVSPEEKGALKANEEFFKKYPVVAEAGQFRVYKIK